MVWGVCRRVLPNHHDAEDAFQATFLVLVRKAASIRRREQLANWLHGVARQTARKARATAVRRGARERQVSEMPEPAERVSHDAWDNLRPRLDHELGLLPERYRAVLVLCDLEGRTRKAAAGELGLPEGTVASRLARARALLARRLSGRGPAVSGAALAAALAQGAASAVPPAVLAATIRAVTLVAAGQALAPGACSPQAVALTKGVLRTMLRNKLTFALAVLAVACLLAAGGAILRFRTVAVEQPTAERERAEPPRPRASAPRAEEGAAPQEKEPPLVDLQSIPRQLTREPAYEGKKHWYCLLVFGPRAETKVWLVHDPGKDWFDPKDDVLYVDRNGNGDLTEADKRIPATVRTGQLMVFFLTPNPVTTVSLPAFHIDTITEVGGKVQHTDLEVVSHGFCGGCPRYTISVKVNGKDTQTTVGGTLRFGTTPQEAPVIHFNGPLTLQLQRWTGLTMVPGDGTPPTDEQRDLTAGKREKFTALLGSKGLGNGTFAAFYANYPPDGINPVAEVEFPMRDPRESPFQAKCELGRRCCGYLFNGELRVPARAAGPARVKLSLPDWPGHPVRPAEFLVPVVQPEKQSGRFLPSSPENGIVRTDIVEGLTRKQVLDLIKSDWTRARSIPDAAMQGQDVWDITESWPLANGEHFVRVRFQGGLVEEVFEYWHAH
jgi:RNA polymerase sigma factor (sigma-70 family)